MAGLAAKEARTDEHRTRGIVLVAAMSLGLAAEGAHAQDVHYYRDCAAVPLHEDGTFGDLLPKDALGKWTLASGLEERCIIRNAYLLARSTDPTDVVASAVLTACQMQIDAQALSWPDALDEQMKAAHERPLPLKSSNDLIAREMPKALEQAKLRVVQARALQCWKTLK